MNLAQLAFTGSKMTAQVAMPREPQDLTAREIDQGLSLCSVTA